MVTFEAMHEDAEFLMRQSDTLFAKRGPGSDPEHSELAVVGGSYEHFKAGRIIGDLQVNITRVIEIE